METARQTPAQGNRRQPAGREGQETRQHHQRGSHHDWACVVPSCARSVGSGSAKNGGRRGGKLMGRSLQSFVRKGGNGTTMTGDGGGGNGTTMTGDGGGGNGTTMRRREEGLTWLRGGEDALHTNPTQMKGETLPVNALCSAFAETNISTLAAHFHYILFINYFNHSC